MQDDTRRMRCTVHGAPCYDDCMNGPKRTEAATQAAARARSLARLRRMADELRAAGWKVEEPS